jgi:hypothetical protein
VVTRRRRPEELLDQLAEASQSPEELAQVFREVTERLAAAEDARRHLLAERDMLIGKVDQVKAELTELSGRMATLQADRQALHRTLMIAEDRRDHAERAAEMFRDQTAQATVALGQARQELAAARTREIALAERIKSRRALPDAGGYDDLRPDPLRAGTAAELIAMLRQFRTWAGNPSYRDMALRSGRRAGASTMCTLLGSSDLPDRLEIIDAIIEGCGGTDEDRQKFATAWRRLAMPGLITAPAPIPEPRLRAVRTVREDTASGDDKTTYAEPLTG